MNLALGNRCLLHFPDSYNCYRLTRNAQINTSGPMPEKSVQKVPGNNALDFIVEEFGFNCIISYAKTETSKLLFQEGKPQIYYKMSLYAKQ